MTLSAGRVRNLAGLLGLFAATATATAIGPAQAGTVDVRMTPAEQKTWRALEASGAGPANVSLTIGALSQYKSGEVRGFTCTKAKFGDYDTCMSLTGQGCPKKGQCNFASVVFRSGEAVTFQAAYTDAKVWELVRRVFLAGHPHKSIAWVKDGARFTIDEVVMGRDGDKPSILAFESGGTPSVHIVEWRRTSTIDTMNALDRAAKGR